jgi:hypothetical protein
MTTINQPKYVVYDLETLKHLSTGCFYDLTTKKKKEFVIYDDPEQLKAFLLFLKALNKNDYILVGFNNLGFDSQILEYMIGESEKWLVCGFDAQTIVSLIHEKAQHIISLQNSTEKFLHLVPEWKMTIPQIDLFRQKHYDGKAKQGTSLKWIQFTMRYPTVEEMPIHHEDDISKEDIPNILKYNWNDVDSTATFFEKNKFETEIRHYLSEKYNVNLINASEPRIAKLLFGKFLSDEMDISFNDLKQMRTFRKTVALKDIVLPYTKFQTPELNAVLDAVNQAVVNPNLNAKENTKFDINFDFGGIDTYVGLGGIHGCCSSGVYENTSNNIIHDIDVVSYYPNLAIQNGLRPRHLGEAFNRVYKMIFDERQKIPKSDPVNYVYKIILNSTYGLSKEINSYLYDPLFTYSITINGQLSLLMLIEKLVLEVPDIKIYQENTDGVTLGYDPQYKPLVSKICDWWCQLTKLELEHGFYKKLIIRDVNNYIGVKDDFDWDEYQTYVKKGERKKYSKIKHKGAFELEIDFHKNPSNLIVPLAAEAYLVGGKDYREFIFEHDDIYDFLAGVKKKSDFNLVLHTLNDGKYSQENLPKVTRYYVSKNGGHLRKEFHSGKKAGGNVGVNVEWKITPLNVVKETRASRYPQLNHTFYIKETEKLIFSIENDANQLKLF